MSFRSPPGLDKGPVFEPQCTHLTMTRLYSPDAICGSCQQPGPFGWVFQCTQDREDMIEHALCSGKFEIFDELGRFFIPQVSLRKRSPAAREDRFSFLDEVTPQDLFQYRPDQVAAILRQRENVHLVIHRDTIRKNSASILNRLAQGSSSQGPACNYDYQKPWVRTVREECQYRVCPRCRPGSADRAFLSLTAVANGEVPPSAAAGFGFHIMGERPVVNAAVLKNIGYRPVSLSSQENIPADASLISDLDVLEILDQQIARGNSQLPGPNSGAIEESADEATPSNQRGTAGTLKRSPRVNNLGQIADSTDAPLQDSISQLEWTPPPSPRNDKSKDTVNGEVSGLAAEKRTRGDCTPTYSSVHGRRSETRGSSPLSTLLNARSLSGPKSAAQDLTWRPPSLGSRVGDSDLTIETAAAKPIMKPRPLPPLPHTPPITPTMPVEEEKDSRFAQAPLRVGKGVAMLEESVELGVPDVITQA